MPLWLCIKTCQCWMTKKNTIERREEAWWKCRQRKQKDPLTLTETQGEIWAHRALHGLLAVKAVKAVKAMKVMHGPSLSPANPADGLWPNTRWRRGWRNDCALEWTWGEGVEGCRRVREGVEERGKGREGAERGAKGRKVGGDLRLRKCPKCGLNLPYMLPAAKFTLPRHAAPPCCVATIVSSLLCHCNFSILSHRIFREDRSSARSRTSTWVLSYLRL